MTNFQGRSLLSYTSYTPLYELFCGVLAYFVLLCLVLSHPRVFLKVIGILEKLIQY